ncbi:MAG: ERCC4 domain-containing protein, partial [Spirochaetaceae bacterium]
MAEQAVWIESETGNPRFPYRIEIRRGAERVIALWVQDRWPGSGKQIFCLREGEPGPAADGDEAPEQAGLREIDRVPITRLDRYGKQLSVILDRPRRKRCNFLFLEKRYKNKPGSYEQIFFRTQGAMQQHRSASRVQLHGHGAYRVIVDSSERYPWKFGGVPIERRTLPAGDYAVEVHGELAAVAERKTYENMLSDFAAVKVLHGKLADLSRWRHAALIIEAEYRDFLSTAKLAGRWPAAHAARVLSELHVLHPSVQIIYAGSRKAAEQWCGAWFAARAKDLWHRREDEPGGGSDGPRSGATESAGQVLGEPPALYGPEGVSTPADTGEELR